MIKDHVGGLRLIFIYTFYCLPLIFLTLQYEKRMNGPSRTEGLQFSVRRHMMTSWVCGLMCSFLQAGVNGGGSSLPSRIGRDS